MKTQTWIVILAVLLISAIGLALSIEKVPVDRVGVKILQIGGGGVIEEDFAPGYVLCVPGLHRIELLDSTLQFYTIAEDGDTGHALNLRGSDQFITKVDVTIVYRLKPGEAHKALLRHGGSEAFKKRLHSFAHNDLVAELGKLETEDFYNVSKRAGQSQKALLRMNEHLTGEHIEVIDVLIRKLEYDQDFEAKLLDKQLLEQKQQLEVSKAGLEKEKETTEKIRKGTEAQVAATLQELESESKVRAATAEAQVAQIEADAEFFAKSLLASAENYKRQKVAEGELLRTQAKAKGDEALNKAYSGFGGELYLVRQMVDQLEFGDIEVNTNRVNPFAVDELLEMLGVPAKAVLAAEPVPVAEPVPAAEPAVKEGS
jgi:regulator of protease activity HflC (stomatin/prohibitin superfamily)